MAVVVSPSQNEIADFRAKGLDIAPHRRRMLAEDLETKFKNPDDPLRIVFVCAMWMTGFDVPSLSTVYLDKPMRNHTLMQTIARANRVFADKTNGLIVDYVGVFRNLQRALAIYGSPQAAYALDDAGDEDTPVKDKSALVAELCAALDELAAFCQLHGIDIPAIRTSSGFERVALLDDAVEALVVNDEIRKKYLALAANVAQLYRAILPDASAGEFTPITTLLVVLANKIRALTPEPDISGVMAAIERLLDDSIASEGYIIAGDHGDRGIGEAGRKYQTDRQIDLGQIDFEALRRNFAKAQRKHIEAQELRAAVERKISDLVARNRTRLDYLTKFQRLIDEYNAGSMNVEILFDRLVVLAQELNAEEQRAFAEQLTEEELAIFDLLINPVLELSEKDKIQVKRAARDLLARLKSEKLVLDWKKRQTTRAAVLATVRDVLDEALPRAYSRDVYNQSCDRVYQHIYDSYADATHHIYAA